MRSIAGVLLAVPLLAYGARAQSELRNRLAPITAPVRYAGTYHLGTGTWTQPGPGGSSLMAASGASAILYDNTCPTGYFIQLPPGGRVYDEGRLPSPTSPALPNSWGLGHDSEVGTQTSYTVDGFQIGYCTTLPATVSYTIHFYEAYTPCGVAPVIPTASFALTGLPGNNGATSLGCWLVDIDLCASSQSFGMQADADTFYDGTAGGFDDSFGWSFELITPPTGSDGYLISGGRFQSGSYQTCSGSDGTVFDQGAVSAVYPANSDAVTLGCGTLAVGASPETGSGMGTQDRFRIENATPTADGCYWFGAVVPGNFHLQLYTANVTLPGPPPGLTFCDPGSGGVIACPCANPPGGAGRGCDNSAATGGAILAASGSATLLADTLSFATAGERPGATSILVQGQIGAGSVAFGQGVRCVSGTLKRLFVQAAPGGGITVPGPGDPPVSVRSAALGDPISSGTPRYYFAMYRDPVVLGGCTATATFNCSDASAVIWN